MKDEYSTETVLIIYYLLFYYYLCSNMIEISLYTNSGCQVLIKVHYSTLKKANILATPHAMQDQSIFSSHSF